MSRYLDPKADVVFKKIFGEHPHLLKSFLNAVLPLPADNQIVELSYLPTEQVPNIPILKRTIADVKCTDAHGRVFIVEMQIDWTDSFKQRLLFGTSQAIVKQLEKGESYKLLQPVYGLGIVADVFDKDAQDWYHHYQLVKQGDSNHDVIEHLQLVFIELPKFPVQSTADKQLRLLWLRFLREIDEKTVNVAQELLDIPEISEAVVLAEESAYTLGELNSYETYWDAVRIEKTLIEDNYEKGMNVGLEKGIKKGIEKGKAEGIAEGIEKGKAEGIAEGIEKGKIEVAKSLISQGIDLSIVSAASGLSADELAKLVK